MARFAFVVVSADTCTAGEPIRLNYRIWIHAGAAPVDELKQAYADYLRGGEVRWEK